MMPSSALRDVMAHPLTFRRLIAGLLLATAVLGITAPDAFAHDEHEDGVHAPTAVVDVVEVHGFLDPVLVDMLANVLSSLDPHETVAVVLQVDSTASVVDDAELARLAELIVAAPVPVSFWVGPSGAEVTGPMARLVALGDDVGIAPGAHLGLLGEAVLGERFGLPFGLPIDTDLVDRAVGYDEAIERGLARPAPVLLEHLVGVPGFEVRTVDGDSGTCLLYTSPSPRDRSLSRMPSSA